MLLALRKVWDVPNFVILGVSILFKAPLEKWYYVIHSHEYQDGHRSLEEAHSSEGSPASWSILWVLTLLPAPSVPFWEKSSQLSLFVGRRMSMWASYKQLFVSMLPVESERLCHEEQPFQLFPQRDNLGQIPPFSSIIRTSLEGIWLLGAGKHLDYK